MSIHILFINIITLIYIRYSLMHVIVFIVLAYCRYVVIIITIYVYSISTHTKLLLSLETFT